MRIATALLVLSAGSAFASLDPRIDPSSGRDIANYPPPRHFDHIHMRLAIDIPDMNKRSFTAVQSLTVTPIGKPRSELVLNARDIKVESVSLGGRGGLSSRSLNFTHEKGMLTIRFDQPVRLGETVDVVTRYSLESPRPAGGLMGGGLVWTRGNASAKSETDQFAQIHTQGQPETNHKWFPCHDSPNERLTTELIVTAEDPYVVSSNGRLMGTALASPSPGGKPRMTWRWLQDKPHSNYLVTLVVGRFSIVGLEARTPDEAIVCSYLYAPVGTERNAREVYGDTPAMVAHFGKLFGQVYPWDKYSQALCRGFGGGMENTSATTMQGDSATASPGSQDDIIAHELAHQWFGDFVTCKTWEHAWLNEGWASFAEALWDEAAAAKGREKREYQRTVTRFVRQQSGLNRTFAPNFPALASRYYTDPFQNFMKPNDIYSKGACVLHMLRMRLGDEVFWTGVRAYLQRHKLGSVETDDFRYCLEEASGLSLERFFTQWCYRPGLPRLNVEIEWVPADAGSPDGAGEVKVSLKQTQKIDQDNPAYALTLPIAIKVGEKTESRVVDMDTTTAQLVVKVDVKPSDVTVDPDLTVVAPVSVKKPLAMWLEQIRHDSLFAQVQAAEHLAEFDDPSARRALHAAAAAGDPELRDAAEWSLSKAGRASTKVAGGAR
jgi:aminopeptidase N